jgi:hypothetical protein
MDKKNKQRGKNLLEKEPQVYVDDVSSEATDIEAMIDTKLRIKSSPLVDAPAFDNDSSIVSSSIRNMSHADTSMTLTAKHQY